MRLHVEIPQSRLRVLPGVGHMIQYFAQDEIAASIDAMTPGASERGANEAMPSSDAVRRQPQPPAAGSAGSY
jgi:hypothetical protein